MGRQYFSKDKTSGIYIQEGFDIKKSNKRSFITDLTGIGTHNPNKMRWFNTFEISQFIRFMVVLTWMKKHFDKLLSSKGKGMRYVGDFGCSKSHLYAYWRGNCNYFNWPLLSYHGVDADIEKIIIGRNSITPKKNDFFNHYVADLLERFTLPKKMDIITCLETIEHVPKQGVKLLLKNIKRNLKKDGIAILSSPNPKKSGEWTWGNSSNNDHNYEWPYEEMCRLLIKSGFVIIDSCGCTPRKEFKRNTVFSIPRDALATRLPQSFVNATMCTIDNKNLCMQWIIMVRKEK